ncbi:hypothetical protein FNX44_020970 [Streptomyces sp. OF1]|uniref:Uncharacterized protein n=1 Tax=Streptomyces alkaliterrae TaxID=2213162 RepID=A0A5P0YWC3_9ACTN|nr:hypothetical protein [Streptomyces alkaliterrae]
MPQDGLNSARPALEARRSGGWPPGNGKGRGSGPNPFRSALSRRSLAGTGGGDRNVGRLVFRGGNDQCLDQPDRPAAVSRQRPRRCTASCCPAPW